MPAVVATNCAERCGERWGTALSYLRAAVTWVRFLPLRDSTSPRLLLDLQRVVVVQPIGGAYAL